jgi:hypothetical protein
MDMLWWNSVPNARRFIEDIADKIASEESLVYNIDDYFPWAETFTSILSEKCTTSERIFKVIYADETGDKPPGEYIKDKYFKPELKQKYRSAIGFERFAAENDHSSVLKNSILLVKCTDKQTTDAWIDFVSGYVKYHKPNTNMCSFIIENCSENNNKSSITNLSARDYFQKYDIDIFTLLITSSLKNERNENIVIKRYSAELASLLAENDIELAALLACNGKKLAFHTDYVVKEILNKELRSNSGNFSISGEVNQIIREAQIKIFYPEIEYFRTWFINKYADDFSGTEALTTYFGNSVDDISCLELGNLKYLCDLGKIEVSNSDFSNLIFYRECRNKLAHTTLLTSDEIERLSKRQY